MENFTARDKQIFEDMKSCLMEIQLVNITSNEESLLVDGQIDTAIDGEPIFSNFLARYFPDLQYVRVGITFPDHIPEEKIPIMLIYINSTNQWIEPFQLYLTLCPSCYRVDAISGICLTQERLPRKEFQNLVYELWMRASYCHQTQRQIVAGEKLEVKTTDIKQSKIPLLMLVDNQNFDDVEEGHARYPYEWLMADIKDTLEDELQMPIILGSDEQMFVRSILIEENYHAVLYVKVPDKINSITLSIVSNEKIDYPDMFKVIVRLNRLNRRNIVGYFVLSVDEHTFLLKKVMTLHGKRLNKTELRWTLRMLLNQANLYFPAITDDMDSDESPDIWLKKRWTDPSYLHESCK